ncbi:uncharacterized protein LOC129549542 [Moschus berezovskii]|uniref:uncharacterized protein LOC129549542 n=1 Tax=Moschus berezovskii TaxID=68408 RepID=UPI0024448969|nr:uncharacterized protein LOC129549542 [Moschus berezovskii]
MGVRAPLGDVQFSGKENMPGKGSSSQSFELQMLKSVESNELSQSGRPLLSQRTSASRLEKVSQVQASLWPYLAHKGSRGLCSLSHRDAHGYRPLSQVVGSEGIQELRSSATALHHLLEESASLLTTFWRAAFLSSPGPALVGKVPEPQDKEPNRRRKEHRRGRDMRTLGESMKKELLELRTKLSKQESLLQSTCERLKTANQQKESMEQFIFSQLTRTHDVLKKARTNLEKQPPLSVITLDDGRMFCRCWHLAFWKGLRVGCGGTRVRD